MLRLARHKELVIRKTEQKRHLLHDLENRALNGGSLRIGEWIKIDRNDGDPIRELLCGGSQRDARKDSDLERTDVFARRIKRVKVIQVRQCAEEVSRAAHLVPDHQAALAGTLNFEHFNHRTVTRLDIPHNVLVNLKRVVGCLFEEHGVRNSAYICLAICATRWGRIFGKVALRDEVTTKLLGCVGRNRAR